MIDAIFAILGLLGLFLLAESVRENFRLRKILKRLEDENR